jgi:hypothetical protein
MRYTDMAWDKPKEGAGPSRAKPGLACGASASEVSYGDK